MVPVSATRGRGATAKLNAELGRQDAYILPVAAQSTGEDIKPVVFPLIAVTDATANVPFDEPVASIRQVAPPPVVKIEKSARSRKVSYQKQQRGLPKFLRDRKPAR
jgi:hypothetical protein